MEIHWLVFLRLRRTGIKTTCPAQKIVGVITKKDCARGTFIFLCMLFEEFHVRFFVTLAIRGIYEPQIDTNARRYAPVLINYGGYRDGLYIVSQLCALCVLCDENLS